MKEEKGEEKKGICAAPERLFCYIFVRHFSFKFVPSQLASGALLQPSHR